MKMRSEVLRIAESYLDHGGAEFRKFAGLPAGASYCNAYVDYVAKEGGVASLYFSGKKETYCPHSIEWCKKNLAQVPLYWALPVDIIYFDWEPNGRPNHIGLVRSRRSSTSIYTVEGNTDKKNKKGETVAHNVVANRTRSGSYVQGVFHVHYVPAGVKKKVLELDGEFGPQTIYNLQLALGMKATGIFTKETAKFLQKKVGATQDGAIGPATARKLQKFLGCSQDSEIGPSTTKALQKWVNKVNYPSAQKKQAETKQKTPVTRSTPKTTAAKKKGYGGTFPTLNTNAKILNGMAFRQCWPYGTKKDKYTYKKGKPLKAYTKGIDKAYPKHKSWPNKRQRVGACCDVFVGECLGNVGIPVPKDLKNQLVKMPKMKKLKATKFYKTSQFKAGMIIQRGRKDKSGHTFMIAEVYYVDKKTGKVRARKYIANSHYKKHGGCYAVMDSKAVDQKPSKWKYYKCYIVPGAVRTYYQKDDYGVDVRRIQAFLKWAGFYKGALTFSYDNKTVKAVNAFQKKIGAKQNGLVTEQLIKKMKAYRK